MLPWNWANGVIRDSARALTADAKLVRSSNLSREVWILRVVGSKAMEFLFSLPVLAALRPDLPGRAPSWYVLAFPLAVLIQTVFLVGIGLTLAPLAVLYTDVKRLLRVVLRVLFYLSPIIYGVRDVQDRGSRVGGNDLRPQPAGRHLRSLPRRVLPRILRGLDRGRRRRGRLRPRSSSLGMVVFSRLEGRVLKEI